MKEIRKKIIKIVLFPLTNNLKEMGFMAITYI